MGKVNKSPQKVVEHPLSSLHGIKSVRVGPYDYTITFQRRPQNSAIHTQMNWGQTDHGVMEIAIDGQGPVVVQIETFIHELIHAVNWTYGVSEYIDQKTNNAEEYRGFEEFVTRQIAMGIIQILRDNPQVLEAISKSLHS